MNGPLLLDLSHSSHTRALTGIQRVCRSLRRALGDAALEVTFDPYEGRWRPLAAWERENLDARDIEPSRRAQWPVSAAVSGSLRRLLPRDPVSKGAGGLIVPEIFSPAVAKALPDLLQGIHGPRVALFHDALALQLPQFAPASTAERFPAYLQELTRFDGIAAVSEDSRRALVDYWSWAGLRTTPPVVALPLGVDPAPVRHRKPWGPEGPTMLCVGTLEGRKNHLALLEACTTLWDRGLHFRLHLVGGCHAHTGRAALERVRALQASGRPLRYGGPATDEALEAAYAESSFTIYPSLAEGFGLPVAESLARGRVCLCRTTGALGEIARAGGCVDLGGASAPDIAAALEPLITSAQALPTLEAVALQRRFRDWSAYAADLTAWMASLGR